jgi:[acyl-carrier-protein] S-malonyltransferase
MGEDIWEKSSEVRDIFSLASEICGIDMAKLCFEGPIETLTETINLQPALTAVEISIFSCLTSKKILPKIVAGHSLGEYPSLFAAGILSLENTIKAIRERAYCMQEAAEKYPGAMLAIVKLDIEDVKEILASYNEKEVGLANYNSPQQIVISGKNKVLEEIINRVKDRGGRAIPLKVSGAWHSSFMEEAQIKFKTFLNEVSFKSPKIEMFFNVTAKSENDPKKITELMWKQLCSPVLWCEEVKNMHQGGANIFVEVGPKMVLAGLIQKILPQGSYKVFSVETMWDIKTLKES